MSTTDWSPPAFDPKQSTLVLAPERAEPGYWVGCPSVLYEPASQRFILTYRQRRPRGVDPERGWRCAIAVSDDGINFSDTWAVEKRELATASMERFCILPVDGESYQLYLSYVDPSDNRWRIDVAESRTLDAFDVTSAKTVLDAGSTGTEGVKDPYVQRVGDEVLLFASFAQAMPFNREEQARAHATADIYNVGVTTCPTGLATSTDGRTFDWQGAVLDVGSGWDRYQARLTSTMPVADGHLGFYDGSSSHAENYEERCGLAFSHDLTTWSRVTREGPWISAERRSVRYLDAVAADGEWWIYFEVTRPDGAHELRVWRG